MKSQDASGRITDGKRLTRCDAFGRAVYTRAVLCVLLLCTAVGCASDTDFRSFVIFEDPNVYAGFPTTFQMPDRAVVSFMHQDLEALRKSKVHAHYGPALKTCYAETSDFMTWNLHDSSPELSDLQDISLSAAPLDASRFVNLSFRYQPGTKEMEPDDVRILERSYSAAPVFSASLRELTGFGTNIYMHDVRQADGGGFLTAGYFVEADKPAAFDFPNAQRYLEHWPEDHRRTHVVFFKGSEDAKSWQTLGTIESTAPYSLCEPSFVQYDDGRIVCLMRSEWSWPPIFPEDLYGEGFKVGKEGTSSFLVQAESNDGGRTWSPPRQLDIWGTPPYLLKLSSGDLLMVYGHRRPPYSVRSIISRDQGRTWDKSTLKELYRFYGGWDIGYPVAVQLRDGRIFCAFYGHTADVSGTNKETPDISVVNKENTPRGIYGCVFSEAWAASKQ